MKLFLCQNCGNLLYFENTACEVCQHSLGFLPALQTVTALEPAPAPPQAAGPSPSPAPAPTEMRTMLTPAHTVRFCANAEHGVCNWLLDTDEPGPFCQACRHNRTIPDVSVPDNLRLWREIEFAKHRLIYALLRLQLPIPAAGEAAEPLVFDFLADSPDPQGPKVMTGHDNGLITLALKEADEVERTKLRAAMAEPYRALLGHFRHEVGHYYWDMLVRDGGKLDACRAVFGDDSQDYGKAINRHYQNGAPADWQTSFISSYATMHPWEDFAETWAHYLHMVDTLETARAFGMRVRPRISRDADLALDIGFDPYRAPDAQALVDAWLPLTYAVNALNRSMGQPDLYPFVVSAPVVAKLQFINELVQRTS